MENVHRSEARPWISKKINIRQFRDNWHNILPHYGEETEPDFKTKMIQALDISEQEFFALEKSCGEDALECHQEELIELDKGFDIPEGVDLKTLRLQNEDLEKRKNDHHYRNLVFNNLKFCNYPPNKITGAEIPQASSSNCQVKLPEIVLTVQVYRPEKRNTHYQKHALSRTPLFQIDQEFLVLGCQFLSELRDKIDCVSNIAVPGDYSEDPTIPPDTKCKDLYKSGFFYINGAFFNDMRDPDCRDYSQIILNWASETDRGIGPFSKHIMEKTKFIDLEIQLGYPYVYAHQGCCEHLLVFSDLCIFSTHDKNREAYPMYVSLIPKKRVFCRVCQIHTAVWVVFDNKRLPENPCFFCSTCFLGFNYTSDGEKEGDFRAYHFPDRTALM